MIGRMSWSSRWLHLEVVVLLGISRLLINVLSFRRLERFLGTRLAESPHELAEPDMAHVRRIGRAVRRVSPHTPWESNCFPQAVTAKVLLGRRGLGSTLYLGARLAESKDELKAHAWLRCGPAFVTGGDGSEQYGAIVSFA